MKAGEEALWRRFRDVESKQGIRILLLAMGSTRESLNKLLDQLLFGLQAGGLDGSSAAHPDLMSVRLRAPRHGQVRSIP